MRHSTAIDCDGIIAQKVSGCNYMSIQTVSKVIVYHDETKKSRTSPLNGHIFLFVPKSLTIYRKETLFGDEEESITPIQMLYDSMMQTRARYSATHKFHFSDISGRKWEIPNVAEWEVIKLGVDALRSRKPEIFSVPLCCKIAIIFYPKPVSVKSYGGEPTEKMLRYDETLMRMLLRGAVHFLYDYTNRVEVLEIVSDGIPNYRRISDDRVLTSLEVREYVRISVDVRISQQSSQHRDFQTNSDEFVNANMLQLADMFLGSIVLCCHKGIKSPLLTPSIGCEIEDKKGTIAWCVKEMLDKARRGKSFINSGHYKSFTLSKAYVQNGIWKFDSIITKGLPPVTQYFFDSLAPC